MKILLLGSGGREHALAWAIAQNPKCDRLTCAPGNAGMREVVECVKLNIEDAESVVNFTKEGAFDFVVTGPEAPLAAGVSDALRTAGFLVFGPSQAAAQLEASKAFTKDICDAAGVPTAAWAKFDAASPARDYVQAQGAPIVIKADGLAAGKGVTVAMDLETALAAIDDCFDGAFGEAGAEVVIEEFMPGEEASFFVLCDGTDVLPIGTAQDHKRAYDGDKGPNTGGMGAYSPAPIMTDALQAQILDQIIRPTLTEMAKRGAPYQGVLYAGVMIADGQARLVEYNVRFGDPECQVLCLRLGAQILDALLACAQETLADARVYWAEDHAMTVVMAAKGYPGTYAKGDVLGGLDGIDDPMTKVFHAGTALDGDDLVSNGGRVLNITARGTNLQEARDRAYAAADQIDWPGGFFRRDIGWRALK
ncbi:phosphoribosylamine--glycine ligase [Halovulum sp. GXIMD14793]